MAATPPVFKTEIHKNSPSDILSEFLWMSSIITFIRIDQNMENIVKVLCTTTLHRFSRNSTDNTWISSVPDLIVIGQEICKVMVEH